MTRGKIKHYGDNNHTRLIKCICIYLFRSFFLPAIVLSALSSCNNLEEGTINLVPVEPAKSANYWCTWYAQNYWVQRGGEITDITKILNPAAREELTYKHLFDPEEGWVIRYLPRGRSDWYFLIDHGWQTKIDTERSFVGALPFFSLQIDPRDFPEYSDAEPQESLRLFNEEIISHGWRGLGIWVRGSIDSITARTFVEWSKYA